MRLRTFTLSLLMCGLLTSGCASVPQPAIADPPAIEYPSFPWPSQRALQLLYDLQDPELNGWVVLLDKHGRAMEVDE